MMRATIQKQELALQFTNHAAGLSGTVRERHGED